MEKLGTIACLIDTESYGSLRSQHEVSQRSYAGPGVLLEPCGVEWHLGPRTLSLPAAVSGKETHWPERKDETSVCYWNFPFPMAGVKSSVKLGWDKDV